MALRQTVVGVLAFTGAAGLMSVIGLATQAQTSPSKTDALLEWPLPPGEQAYAQDRRQASSLSTSRSRRRSRGGIAIRAIRNSGDASSEAPPMRRAPSGSRTSSSRSDMSDVRIQPLELSPQWFPQQWDVTVTGGGKTITLDSAQPDYRAAALPPGGIDVEAVYGGMGSAADSRGQGPDRAKRCSPTRCSARTTRTR